LFICCNNFDDYLINYDRLFYVHVYTMLHCCICLYHVAYEFYEKPLILRVQMSLARNKAQNMHEDHNAIAF
jgi:hypothetical protein